MHSTASEIPLKEFYDSGDISGLYPSKQLGRPGHFPFTRGIHPQMYSSRLWTMRQYSGFASAEATNARFKFLLRQGQTGLSTAFDLPTQIGYDPDHRMARPEIGRVGVSVCTLRDMHALLDGIPLDKISLSMTINATAIILLGFLLALARKQRVPLAKLSGTIQNDILKEYIARGTFIYPPVPSLRLCGDIIEYCNAHLPRFHPISVSGYHMREAGATAVQEIAFTMANALAYAQMMRERKIPLDRYGRSLSFFFSADNDFFEEIAKFRAARRIWAHLAKQELGARDTEVMKLRFHAQTAGSTLTHRRAKNNLSRVTYQALAAVLGGAQSLHVNAWDEAIGLPTEASATAALRTQQIIAHETGVTRTADPLGGSYFVEYLTSALENRSRALMRKIRDMGGSLRAIENGFMQDEIHRSALRKHRALENGEGHVVGVSIFQDSSEKIPRYPATDSRYQNRQMRRVAAHRRARAAGPWRSSLERLRDAAEGKVNLVEPVVKAAESGATLGEISDVFRAAFSEYKG